MGTLVCISFSAGLRENSKNTCQYDEDNMRLQVSPNQALLRKESYEGQIKQEKIMKAWAKAVDGNISFGDVVQVGLHGLIK